MSKEEKSDRPKIYVSIRGGLSVKADELLQSKKVRAIIDEMAKSPLTQPPAPSKRRVEEATMYDQSGGHSVKRAAPLGKGCSLSPGGRGLG